MIVGSVGGFFGGKGNLHWKGMGIKWGVVNKMGGMCGLLLGQKLEIKHGGGNWENGRKGREGTLGGGKYQREEKMGRSKCGKFMSRKVRRRRKRRERMYCIVLECSI